MKIQKITLLSAMLLAVVSTQNLSATEARSGGMGLDVHPWAVDGQLPYIFENPAALGNFSPMVYGETDTTATGSKGGILLNFGNDFSLGVFAGQRVQSQNSTLHAFVAGTGTSVAPGGLAAATATYTSALTPANVFGSPTSALNNQNIDLIAAYNLGNFIVGLGASYARTANDYTESDTFGLQDETMSLSDSSFKAILGVALNMNSFVLDASAAYRSTDVANTYSYSSISPVATVTNASADLSNDGIGDILLNVQAILDLGKENKLHTLVGFDLLNASATANSSYTTATGTNTFSDTYDNSAWQIRAGVSDEMKFTEKLLAFVGVAFNYGVRTTSTSWTTFDAATSTAQVDTDIMTIPTVETTFMTIPVFFGLEANLSEKWMARFGLSANILNTPGGTTTASNIPLLTDTTSTSDAWSNATPTMHAGVSFNLENFSFDWNMALDLFTNGPYFVTGTPAATGFATQFAISYKLPGGKNEKTPIRR